MMVRVSVGMPVYNGGRWLPQAIESLLTQTYRNFELIISDNASTDDTEVICRGYEARDTRIKYYRNARNFGASDNYNAVVSRASGEYFKWASCNDVCKPSLIAHCVEVLDRQRDVVLCYPKTVLFNDVGLMECYEDNMHLMQDEPLARFERLLASMLLNNAMNGLIRTKVLRQTSLIKIYLASDVNMMAELALRGKFFELPEYLYYRRMDENAATSMKGSEQLLEHYYPKRDHRMLLQHWKRIAGHFGAVHRAPLSMSQKCKCYHHLLRRFGWARTYLFQDIIEALRETGRSARIH